MLSREMVQALRSSIASAAALTSLPPLRMWPIGGGIVAFLALTAVTLPTAWFRMFTGFRNYDDEGYFLMYLKSFLDTGWHYEGVNGYGIFYYQFWASVFSAFGLPVTNDAGRSAVLVVWLLTSLIAGVATWWVTRSIILGLGSQLAVFLALVSLTPEPMHPGSLIALLLVVIAALACAVQGRWAHCSMALIGAAVAALLLIKINVGIFALVSVAFACTLSYPVIATSRWLRLLFEIGFIALPALLMKTGLDNPKAREFAAHITLTALALVIAGRALPNGGRDGRELWWLSGGLAGAATVSLGVALLAGSSTSELWDGMIGFPLAFRASLLQIGNLPHSSYLLDLAAVVGSLCFAYLVRRRRARATVGWACLAAALSITAGLVLAFPMIWSFALSTTYATQQPAMVIRWDAFALAWVAVIRPPGSGRERLPFVAALLPSLAVLQALHTFPMAGSQMWWSTFLLVPVGALCIANGLRWLAFGYARSRHGPQPEPVPLLLRGLAPTLVLAVLSSNIGIALKHDYDNARHAYQDSTALRLPGAMKIHVASEYASTLRDVTAAIKWQCQYFVSLPGMSSFYLWTGRKLPENYPPASAPILLGLEQQNEMVKGMQAVPDLCLLRYPPGTKFWSQLTGLPPSPVMQYLESEFTPIGEFGKYQLLKRED